MIKPISIYLLFITTALIGQVNTESMRSPYDFVDGIQNTFNLDINYENANSEVLELFGEYRLDYIRENNFHSFIILNLNQEFEKENNEPKNIISNKGFIHFRTTKNIKKNYQLEIFTQYGFNDFLLLDERYLVGSGIRFGLKSNQFSKTNFGIGFMYEKEIYDSDENNQKKLFRSTNYINNYFIFNSNFNIKNTAYFQVVPNNFNDFRILFDSKIEFYANNFLSLSISLNYRYDNDPHGDLDNSYIQLANGISVKF